MVHGIPRTARRTRHKSAVAYRGMITKSSHLLLRTTDHATNKIDKSAALSIPGVNSESGGMRLFPSTGAQSQSRCQICRAHAWKYTCPKPNCGARYCSVTCYKSHSNKCTEAFYRDKVLGCLNISDDRRTSDMEKLLQRHHNDLQRGNDAFVDDDEDVSSADGNQFQQQWSQHINDSSEKEDSEEILRKIEMQALRDEPIDVNELPLSLRLEFERDVHNNLELELWIPWWIEQESPVQEISVGNKVAKGSCYLDSCLSSIPKFEYLFPSTSTFDPAQLRFNAVDILCSVCRVLRLFNGECGFLDKAKTDEFNDGFVLDAAHTLLQSSQVLSDDARYESMHEVMVSIYAASYTSSNSPINEVSFERNLLVEDVVKLSRSVVFIWRAFSEGVYILDHAIMNMKSRKADMDKKVLRKVKQAKKKMIFYTSWSVQYWREINSEPESITNDILGWVDGFPNSNG